MPSSMGFGGGSKDDESRPKQFLEIRDGQWLWPNNHFPTSIKKNDPAFISKNLKNKKNTLY
jgi:hypothetical protein